MARPPLADLHHLARLYGVQTAYYDVERRRRPAAPEALLAALRALGAPVSAHTDAVQALRQRRLDLWQRSLEPVAVAWDGGPTELELRLPAAASGPVACHLHVEEGEVLRWSTRLDRLGERDSVQIEGTQYRAAGLPLPYPLPTGYHRLTLELPGRALECTIIAAPRQAYAAFDASSPRAWGAFLPLYALHTRRSWGAADLSDLQELLEWVAGRGGAMVGTLPLLAAFLDDPCEPSPYAPASRLFWNELYVDPTRAPDLSRSPEARALLSSSEIQGELAALRSTSLVEYRRLMALKRRVLAEMSRCLWAEPSPRLQELRRWIEADPARDDYARFRAAGERRQAPWPAWLGPARDGVLHPGDYEEEARRYHLYAQWLADEQFRALSARARDLGARLYLDLPLGVHPHGFDIWHWPHLFARGASAGAPPDTFFTRGQSWGFPPLHPEASRAEGHRYFIASLRHQLQIAGLLRIDHIMALHRLFWVPDGMDAHQGVYVRYPAEELYAILCLESHRQHAGIVGENLGTVPRQVGAALRRHNIRRLYVLQYEVTSDPLRPLRAVPRDAVASLNTHDMPPFAAFWQSLDIEERQRLGLLDTGAAQQERAGRNELRQSLLRYLGRAAGADSDAEGPGPALHGCLEWLGASHAQVVMANFEDLWQETQPHNVPGTGPERPNWLRKARYGLDEFREMADVVEALREVDRLRRRAPPLGPSTP